MKEIIFSFLTENAKEMKEYSSLDILSDMYDSSTLQDTKNVIHGQISGYVQALGCVGILSIETKEHMLSAIDTYHFFKN